jgi:hypothetical protein
MDITIAHLTDIHFTEKTDLTKKIEPLARAIISELGRDTHLFFVISGDIAFSGRKVEYDNASKFFSILKTLINAEKPSIKINLIIVPGNHDCNFDYNSQVRINTIANINYQTFGTDMSVRDIALVTQKDFWEFYSKYNEVPIDKLYYKLSFKLTKIIVNFHCLNTAWMSKLDEEVGSIFFPVNLYKDIEKEENSLNFGVWHHPYNWFNPNTLENNKLEFEQLTESISSTHFLGHEHKQRFLISSNRDSDQTINLLSGEIFNEDKKINKSAFQILNLVTNSLTGELRTYSWNEKIYEFKNSRPISFHQENKRRFNLNNDYKRALNELKIPLLIDNKNPISLQEIYVYPDLEPSAKDSDKLEFHFSSARLINSTDSVIIIDGDSQVGKTSLMSMLFFKFYEKNKYPILFSGKDIKDTSIRKNLKTEFIKQYSEDALFEEFRQLEKSKKVLLIDDFQDCLFNPNATKDFIENCQDNFGTIIIGFDSANNILANLKLDFKKASYYSIKPFGYKKRNELVEKYHFLNLNTNTFNEKAVLEEVKMTFDSVQAILGDRLMPAYPVFLLSIIQALKYKPIKQDETSFGYCYQTLINYALLKSGVKNDEIDSYLNFLTEFAFFFVEKEVEEVDEYSVSSFYSVYSSKFITPPLNEIINTLKSAKIIDHIDNSYKFSYNYILYFLSAKKLADLIHTKSGMQLIGKLFTNLENERNANILVFITHHSKDISFIEDSLLNSMLLLDKLRPISLEKDDPFYKEIIELAERLKNDFIDSNRTPEEERKRQLEENEKQLESSNKSKDDINYNENEINEAIAPFIKSSRSIEIIGQIVKNRKGSLEKKHLHDLISETYTTGFRAVSYFSELLKSMRTDLSAVLDKHIESSDTRHEIENKILTFLQLASLKICIHTLTKLTFCVGTKELKDIYIDVAKNIGTPAAKLVTFSINSYYGKVSVSEVKSLAQEFKDNIVAMQLLRSRVRFYVYNRDLDFSTKQKLASALKMTLLPPKRNPS